MLILISNKTMQRVIYLSILAIIHQYAIAQDSRFFMVNIAIEEKSELNNLLNNHEKAMLFNKITKLCNNKDGVIIDEYSDYFLVSDIYPSSSRISNAGYLPVGSFKMEFQLKLTYEQGGKTFKQINFSKEYVANTEREAVNRLINDFTFSEIELNDFFDEGFKKMSAFYSENCNSLVESAKRYQNVGEPEKALALCLTIPTDVPCYGSISKLSKELYTSLSYKTDYSIFLQAQEFVSKGAYESAFASLNEISIYSQFYSQAQSLGTQINNFIFNQKEIQKKKELAESEQKLKEAELLLQVKRNELQQSINQANIDIAQLKNESDRQIALQQLESNKQLKNMELQSQERKEMIKTAGSLLNSYINRPQPPRYTNFYIIK
jgi:hypothetical protein